MTDKLISVLLIVGGAVGMYLEWNNKLHSTLAILVTGKAPSVALSTFHPGTNPLSSTSPLSGRINPGGING